MDNFLFVFEIIGTAAYAVLGALKAVKKEMDMFGTVVLGLTTAIGGGVIRDIILGSAPPRAFVHPVYAAVAIIFSAVVLLPAIRKYTVDNEIYNKIMFMLDTFGLALFTVMGVGIVCGAEEYNLFLVVFVGVITGVGGGVLRDVLSGDIPYIFVKHIYACASIAGAVICAVMWEQWGRMWAMLAGMTAVIVIRCLSSHFRWNLPVQHLDR